MKRAPSGPAISRTPTAPSAVSASHIHRGTSVYMMQPVAGVNHWRCARLRERCNTAACCYASWLLQLSSVTCVQAHSCFNDHGNRIEVEQIMTLNVASLRAPELPQTAEHSALLAILPLLVSLTFAFLFSTLHSQCTALICCLLVPFTYTRLCTQAKNQEKDAAAVAVACTDRCETASKS